MVDSHAGAEQPLEDLSEARCELRALHRPGNRLALLLGGNPGVRQRLRGVECGILREMHDVNGVSPFCTASSTVFSSGSVVYR